MKKLIASCLMAFSIVACSAHLALAGDTIHVQTFKNNVNLDSVFLFPSDTIRFEKILMYYKLKCNPANTPYQCGEWDYLTYTYMYEHTGMMDSTLLHAPSYTIDGASPDSVKYMDQPSWKYSSSFQPFINYTSVISFDSALVGAGMLNIPQPAASSSPVSRSQYLWKASELIAAGLTPGNITGMRLFVQATGSTLNNLTVRLKNTSRDSIRANYYETTGFTTAFHHHTTFAATGWNTLHFPTSFNWDGISNVLVEVTYDNSASGTDNVIVSENTGWYSGIYSNDADRSQFFEGSDYVEVPYQAFAPIDSFITVGFWQYGNPAYQPQQQSIFEGLDSLGRRVINAHLPWDNANVYWDAGNNGSYDRISQLASNSNFEGQWNYWAFTKNASSGVMNIYLNGHLWLTGTNMHRLMSGIKTFKVGSAGNGTSNYDGNIDEFTVWNTVLDSTTIQAWMYKDIDATHPFYSNLRLYYQFNTISNTTTMDASPNGFNGTLMGTPVNPLIPGSTLFRNFVETSERPNVVFEHGVYTSTLDSTLVIDSVQNPPMTIVKFENYATPTVPTDTITVWPTYYSNYLYTSSGIAFDSTFVAPDTTLYLHITDYYSAPFEVVNRFELGRYITPYGIQLNLGSGFTWVYDVSDYRTLLHDSIRLTAGNWQELLDLSFDFIKGVPPRDIVKIENVWNGNYGLSSFASDVQPKTVNLLSTASQFRLKTRTTGHGQGGASGCGEFCPKNHSVTVGGLLRYQWLLWDTCARNPLYPQGGTWIYQRGGWSPGMDVKTYDWELTPFVTPGTPATIDYNADYDSQGNYVLETQLVSYSAPNFSLDASVEHVKSPSKMDMYLRMNPICSNPVITIKNTGTSDLTSLKINYGMLGSANAEFTWTGNLKFLEEADVTLGSFWWTDSSNTFEVIISEPNGGTDQYPDNNRMTSVFSIPPSLPGDLVFVLGTNNNTEDSYEIRDDSGNLVFARAGTSVNTTYKDTLHLPPGCYTFKLTDTGEDGLYFWNNTPQGSGSMTIKKASGVGNLKVFGNDFGSEIYYQFSVGYYLNTPEIYSENSLSVYPNPAMGNVFVDARVSSKQDIRIEVLSEIGEKVYETEKKNSASENFELDLSSQPAGIYFIKTITRDRTYNNKILLVK